MRVPNDASRGHAAQGAISHHSIVHDTSKETDAYPEVRSRPNGVRRASTLLGLSNRSPRCKPPKEEAPALDERHNTCTRGEAFYTCANGFTGCCSVDPCNPGGTCPNRKSSSFAHPVEATSTGVKKTSSRYLGGTSTVAASVEQTRGSSIVTASSTDRGHATSSKTQFGSVPSPPACPQANLMKFTDNSKIAYYVHCNTDNSYSSDRTISVGTGSYGECFSACSMTKTCAGFTYVGHDSGTCYLKGEMPKSQYVPKEGDNYISCAKIHPAASAPEPTASASGPGTKKIPVGAIVGGVIGGVLLIGLILLLIAFCARRKRKKIEERREMIITRVAPEPIETQQLTPHGHQRSISTSHDIYLLPGGSYYPPQRSPTHHRRSRSIYQEQTWI